MPRIFAIDPSIRACGWAKKDSKSNLIHAGLCRSNKKRTEFAIQEIFDKIENYCPYDLDYLIIEKPIIQQNWTRNRIQDVSKLLMCYGSLLLLAMPDTKLITPTVPEWKGQLPKEVSHERMFKTADRHGFIINITDKNKTPKSLMHNVYDAIALLITYLEKENLL